MKRVTENSVWFSVSTMMRTAFAVLGAVVSVAILLVSLPFVANAQKYDNKRWDRVWQALPKAPVPDPVPPAAAREGAPVRQGKRVLFRFRPAMEATRVYLAGDFNGWASNNNGRVSDSRYAMRRSPSGVWYKWAEVTPQTHPYKYVVVDKSGTFRWVSDPFVSETDGDGNTRLDFATITMVAPAAPTEAVKPSRALKPAVLRAAVKNTLQTRCEKVWTRPDQDNTLVISLKPEQAQKDMLFFLRVETPLGKIAHTGVQLAKPGVNRLLVPALKQEGGYIARVSLVRARHIVAQSQTVLSVAKSIADDLRYGFYATYTRADGNYGAKAAMLADLHINALEYYDYFPAHGYYAPREANYQFEPFGTKINAVDIQRKIKAGHGRNILSLAYVAAYAASESVYKQHPDPMTDANGIPKIFNGTIMSETEADRTNKPKWFWLMNVAPGSEWHNYILGEFERALDDKPGDLVSFDGFEIDTYGDSTDTRFYAKNTPRSGDYLRDVLHDFVGDVHALTHRIKPQGLVSFNSVNEFGVGQMYDVTDFLFLEIWRGHTDSLADVVDICYRHRAPHQQRVVLKMYPADRNPSQKVWTENALRRLLAATMTGAGSLMVAGEPDEKTGQMHALNTLYYPDHQPMPAANRAILHDYYAEDALLFGYTHGRGVANTFLDIAVPDCITRTYAAPGKKALVVQLLHTGADTRWSTDVPDPSPKKNYPVSLPLPGGVAPKAVYFASPDSAVLHVPVKLDFVVANGKLQTLLPELRIHGTVILQYE